MRKVYNKNYNLFISRQSASFTNRRFILYVKLSSSSIRSTYSLFVATFNTPIVGQVFDTFFYIKPIIHSVFLPQKSCGERLASRSGAAAYLSIANRQPRDFASEKRRERL